MDDLLSRFQSTRVSYELKPEEAEVIRARYNAASGAPCHPARSGLSQPPSNTHSAREFRTWKVSVGSLNAHLLRHAPSDAPYVLSSSRSTQRGVSSGTASFNPGALWGLCAGAERKKASGFFRL